MLLSRKLFWLAFLLTSLSLRCVAGVTTASPGQDAKIGQNCTRFTANDRQPRVMLVGSLPTLGYEMITQLKVVMGGSLKVIHKLQPNEIGMLCNGEDCAIDLENDLCSTDMNSISEVGFIRLLRETQVIFYFSDHQPTIGDTISLARLMHAANNVPSAPRLIHVLQGATHWHSELADAAISDAPKLFHPSKKINYIGELVHLGDVYGPQDIESVENPAIIPILIHQAFTSDILQAPPEPASPFYDFIHARDVATALQEVSKMGPTQDVTGVITGQVSSLGEIMSIIADLSLQCLKRNVRVPVKASSFRAASHLSNISQPSLPPNWQPQFAIRTGIAATMMEMLKARAKKQGPIPGVDMNAAIDCLEEEAHTPGKIHPFLTLSAQLGHSIICKPPPGLKLGSKSGKTLVALIGVIRAARLTWLNFQEHVLKAKDMGSQVDIALASPAGHDSELEKSINAYYANAKYIWEVNNPPDNNYRFYFDEIARACFNRSFTAVDASIIGRRFRGNFMGLIKEAKHDWGGAALLLFKWLALQQMMHLNLLEQYQYIIISRSDFMWTAPHPSVTQLAPSQVLIPTGSDWNGLNDRHAVMLAEDAAKMLSMCNAIIDRPGPEVIEHLLSTGLRPGAYGSHNSEAYLLWWTKVHKIEAKRFPCISYIVWDRQQPGNNYPFFRPLHPKPATVFVIPKYIEEYEDSMKNKEA